MKKMRMNDKNIKNDMNAHYIEVNGTYMAVPRSFMWYRYNNHTNMWNGEIIPTNKTVSWVQSQETGYYIEVLSDNND
jgi:hypothetical protein